ncbi:Argininosuccinate lyase [Vanrija pseudolonga]|uniref:Arginosuccinase n=1 Tax=Vanrija pseudolonga TaxID=143232 RepID=A0AAF1BNH0_9TREE|nr:Argininosuccinate lyase [Vanrija pseudolonga]
MAITVTETPTDANGAHANGKVIVNASGHGHATGHATAAFTEARLAKPPSAHLLQYDLIPLLEREKKQFDQYLQIDLAHLVMLVEQGIVARDVGRALLPALSDLRKRGAAGVNIDPAKGSMLLQIEGTLAAALGEDIAGNLHTGRSRIDQGATARRLFKRNVLLEILNAVATLEETLIKTAKRHPGNLIPTYTHLQQAQPGHFAHYLLGYADRLHDDFQRCSDAFARANRSPLGCVGLSGTSWPIDRQRTRELLGFDDIVLSSRLAREAYYAAEIASSLAFVMATLNDLATDLHIWSSIEFGFIQLDDGYCSTSSIFPQKKNPVALEVIKYGAGPAVNWGGSALAAFRGEGSGDQAVRKVPELDAAFDKTIAMLDLAGGIVSTLTVNSDRVQKTLHESWSTTSNLADELVRKNGLSFRQAHHVVARLVRICEVQGIARAGVTPAVLSQAAFETLGQPLDGWTAEELSASLDPVAFVQTRISEGSIGPEQLAKLTAVAEQRVKGDRMWLQNKKDQIALAASKLDAAIVSIVEG